MNVGIGWEEGQKFEENGTWGLGVYEEIQDQCGLFSSIDLWWYQFTSL